MPGFDPDLFAAALAALGAGFGVTPGPGEPWADFRLRALKAVGTAIDSYLEPGGIPSVYIPTVAAAVPGNAAVWDAHGNLVDFGAPPGGGGGGGLADAPSDGTLYGRKNAAWTAAALASHGHVPADVTFAATDKVLARTGVGGGAGSEVDLTAAGRALIDDATAADQRTTLGLGDSATKNVGTGAGDVAAGSHAHAGVYAPLAHGHAPADITFAATDKLLGRTGVGGGAGSEVDCTAAGRAVLAEATAQAQRSVLGSAEMRGFEVYSDGTPAVTRTYDPTTRKVTITAKGGAGTFNVYVRGVRYTVASPHESAAHGTDTGAHFYYHAGGGGWTWSYAAAWDIMQHAPASLCVYESTASPKGFELLETHTVGILTSAHAHFHEVFGTLLVSGGDVGDFLLDTDTDASMKFSVSRCIFRDEDLKSDNAARAALSTFTQLYRTGAAGTWTWETGLALPYTSGTYGRINKVSGGVWGRFDVASFDVFNLWLLAVPSSNSDFHFVIVPGQVVYTGTSVTAVANARQEQFRSLSLGTFPFAEFVVIARLTFRSAVTYGTTGKTRLMAVDRITESRAVSTAASGSSLNHEALTGLLGGAAGDHYHLTSAELAAVLLARGPRRVTLTRDQMLTVDAPSLAVGQIRLDASLWPSGATIKLRSVGMADGASAYVTATLYNLTDDEAVTNAYLEVDSADWDAFDSVALTVGAAAGNLKSSSKIYEVRLALVDGVGDDFGVVGSLDLEIA